MEQRVAIVTGGLRGLGRAMVFGLAREGHHVVAVGHIDADVAEVEAEAAGTKPEVQILPLVADLRRPADCKAEEVDASLGQWLGRNLPAR